MEYEVVIRLSSFVVILLLVSLWEYQKPRRILRLAHKRWLLNFGLVLLNSVLLKLLIPAGAVGVAIWSASASFGLFHMVMIPDLVKVVLAVVLLDLFIYVQHVLVHKVPLLWRLHQVHHADCDMDVSTALRFHPLEIVMSMGIKMAMVALLGAPVLAVILFEVILNGMAMFNHGNIRLPLWLDVRLRWVIATPDMHRIHHSIVRAETDSNYGFNLSFWDRVFGTYRAYPKEGQDDMVIGIAEFQHERDQRFTQMLILPFQKPRD